MLPEARASLHIPRKNAARKIAAGMRIAAQTKSRAMRGFRYGGLGRNRTAPDEPHIHGGDERAAARDDNETAGLEAWVGIEPAYTALQAAA
jgi:hypothetical protein